MAAAPTWRIWPSLIGLGRWPAWLTLGLALVRATGAAPAEPGAADWRERLRYWAKEANWQQPRATAKLTRQILLDSVEAARVYYLRHQKPDGNFDYTYDAVKHTLVPGDNAVRQAGALWGLCLLCRDRPTIATRAAAIRGLDFFFRASQALPGGGVAPVYPAMDDIETGTVALLCLAITDFVRGQDEYLTKAGRGLYDGWLSQYLNYLHEMELANGSWGQRYSVVTGRRDPESSPYFDGESLLAYCLAARYAGRKELLPRIEMSATALARRYTVDTWADDWESDQTKGFFQWGCMAFAEYVEAGWPGADVLADTALALAWWMINDHAILSREGNAGYAVEGLLAVYRIAQLRQDHTAMARIREVAEPLLARVTTWQIDGPLADQNSFLRSLKSDPLATGGIMSSVDSGLIRIDTVQHQLHADLLALRLLFPDPPGGG